MRLIALIQVAVLSALGLWAQDAREVVRKSVELDQANWLRMRNYTWVARNTERHLDSKGNTKSTESEAWETLVLYGELHRRIIETNGKPLPPDEQRKQQEKLDKAVAKLEHSTGLPNWKRNAGRIASSCARSLRSTISV